MEDFNLGAEDPRTYIRLAAQLRDDIEAGKYKPGEPVPSIASASRETGHARQTVSKAWCLLVEEGLLIRYPGLGYYVCGTPHNVRSGSAGTVRRSQ